MLSDQNADIRAVSQWFVGVFNRRRLQLAGWCSWRR